MSEIPSHSIETPAKKKTDPKKIIAICIIAIILEAFAFVGMMNAYQYLAEKYSLSLESYTELLTSYTDVLEKYYDDEYYISAANSRVFEYYGEKDVVKLTDSVYGETWLQALTDVAKNTYNYSNIIVDENGFKYYTENNEVVSKLGIDVSYYQGNIDWDAVKGDGIDFVIIRVGYRGYETGSIMLDSKFYEYINGATAAGLDIGVYFYSQAITTEEAIEEAEFVIDAIEGYEITYPVVFDWEIVGEDTARTNDITVDTINECTTVFCNTIAKAGYIPMIYTLKKQALMKLDLSQLAGFDIWLAEYKDEPEFPYYHTMWQYASDATVSGISGNVDINISYVDYSTVRR